jgi:Leucine-rich repeat (LRR) protein
LKVLDGVSIEQAEHMDAKETFAGRLTEEILESRLGPGRKLSEVKELDLSSCRLRDFDNMFDESLYPNLRDLNLSHNSLVTLRGFGYLPKLRILKIKANRLETLFCKPNDDGYPKGLFGLPGLEVLDVSYNNLHDLYGLQYSPLKDLKILNASNNDIVKVDFLEKLKALRELDLSKNRIRQLDATSFSNFHVITCLRLEDNGLRNL